MTLRMLSGGKEFQTLCCGFSCAIGLLPFAKQLFLSQFVSFEFPETRKSDVLVMWCLHFDVMSH